MSGVLCEACGGLFPSSKHPCAVPLLKGLREVQEESKKLNEQIMEMQTKPDYERGELDGQDVMMRHIAMLKDDSNSALAGAVRKSELYQLKVRLLAQLADKLECASYKIGEPFDPEAAKAFYSEFCILQKRCELFAKDEVKLEDWAPPAKVPGGVSADFYKGWTACKEQAARACDDFINKRWPDLGDRPSSPPAAVLMIADTIMALREPPRG